MLVISMHKNDRVMIRDESGKLICVVTQVEIQPGKSRIGFEAEQSIKIWREKLDNQIQATPEREKSKGGVRESNAG